MLGEAAQAGNFAKKGDAVNSFPVHLIVANIQEERVRYAKTPLQVLCERFGPENVSYAKGCDILTERDPQAPVFPGDVDSDRAAQLMAT
jgi:beta-glucosidase